MFATKIQKKKYRYSFLFVFLHCMPLNLNKILFCVVLIPFSVIKYAIPVGFSERI